MKVARLQYTATKAETETTVFDWLQATAEFHNNYIKINEALRNKTSTTASDLSGSRATNLLKLRQHMNVVLETLLTDMSKPQPTIDRTYPSKSGHLVIHTRLLKEISRKVEGELVQFLATQTEVTPTFTANPRH